jgi:pyrroloquinoline quinone (PQQ) biosynthesis protein C
MALPELAALEFHGLATRYGFSHGPETAYFRERADHDRDQALTRAALAGLLVTDDPFALLCHAELVHRCHWEMLDGMQRRRTE